MEKKYFNVKRQGDNFPEKGKLLIAEPMLSDTNFSRAVILLVDHNENGSIGFILNKTLGLRLSDIIDKPQLLNAYPLYNGGPVQQDTLHMLHNLPSILGGTRIVEGVYWGGSFELLQEIAGDPLYHRAAVRLFLGYSGWMPGQLEAEYEEDSWLLANANNNLVFYPDTASLWKEAVLSLGEDYAKLLFFPSNPSLN